MEILGPRDGGKGLAALAAARASVLPWRAPPPRFPLGEGVPETGLDPGLLRPMLLSDADLMLLGSRLLTACRTP